MRVLKVIAMLLHYPDGRISEHADELSGLIRSEERLQVSTRDALIALIDSERCRDLLDSQADYVALFDRGRSLSLHLFEHVHGESRDRGQALVDLLSAYRQQGYDISANELPDYIPLFLEFCSLLPDPEAVNWLQQTEHLLQLLHGRLEMRESPYAILFKALLELGGLEAADEQLRHKLKTEPRDDTPRALDLTWAEEPVMFGPAAGCDGVRSHTGQAVPIDTSSLHRQTAAATEEDRQ